MNQTTYGNRTNESNNREDYFWKPSPLLKTGKIYETVVNGREVGDALFVRLGGKLEASVLFVEDGFLTCYKFNSYDVDGGRLLLDNASRRPLSDIEEGMVARTLKRKGLL